MGKGPTDDHYQYRRVTLTVRCFDPRGGATETHTVNGVFDGRVLAADGHKYISVTTDNRTMGVVERRVMLWPTLDGVYPARPTCGPDSLLGRVARPGRLTRERVVVDFKVKGWTKAVYEAPSEW